MSFPSLEKEVRFFAYWAAEWLADKNPHMPQRRYTKEETIVRIEQGKFEIAFDVVGDFTPIRILPRYERFRERARKAGLEYLKTLPDKH